jgi:cell division protein FtsW
MSTFSPERVERERYDTLLLGVIIMLVGIGLSVLFSASYFYSERLMGDPLYFFKKQAAFVAIGAAAAFVLSRLSLDFIRRAAPVVLLAAFALSLMTFLPGIGTEALGANRWIAVGGASFQPSELVKLALVLYLASIFAKKQERINDLVNSVLPPVIVASVFAGIVYLQNDFSTAFFLFALALVMFFVAGVRLIYFAFLGTFILPMSAILLFTKEHRVQRLIAFLDPRTDPIGSGYQVIASRSALAHGGLWGAGLGMGTKKLGGLPEAHSDFVFAVLAEELGLLGVVAVCGLFLLFALRGYGIAIGTEDRFARYLAFGLTTSVFLQAMLNMAVVCGLVPATGIPLPFFSQGGSSVFVSLCMCGLLLNLSRKHTEREKEEHV